MLMRMLVVVSWNQKVLSTLSTAETYASLRKQLSDKSLTPDQISAVKVKATAREQLLLPVYMQVSLQFADLHDRAGRMKAKDVIRQSLVWREARRFFYWRVRRRVNEEYILKRMFNASKNPLSSRSRNMETLAAWTGVPNFAQADRDVAIWYEENRKVVHEKVELLKTEGVAFDVATLLRGNSKGGLKGVQQVLSMLPAEEREAALKYLSQA